MDRPRRNFVRFAGGAGAMFLAGASGILKSAIGAPASKGSDIEALTPYITSVAAEQLLMTDAPAGPQIRNRLLYRIEKPFKFGLRI